MMNKFNLIKPLSPLLFVIFFLVQITPVVADGDQDIVRLPPHPDLGIADINTGLETAHTPLPPGLGYKYLDANYQQALNLGTSWNRWKVDWSYVERMSGQFTWVCQAGCAPGFGEYFDYPRLAQEDESRGINSLVILAEIPTSYQFDPGNNDQLIEGLDDDIFCTDPTCSPGSGTTNDPNQATGINDANRWAKFVYVAMEELGQYGVQHWQIMNEPNTDSYWAEIDPNDPANFSFGPNSYVRALDVAAKIIQYRNSNDTLVTGGLVYKAMNMFGDPPPIDDSVALNDWSEIMFGFLNGNINNIQPEIMIALHPYDRSKTSYDFPIQTKEYFSVFQSNLVGIPIWLTETGSSDCSDEEFPIPLPPNPDVTCPPSNQGQSRSNEEQHADYMIQSMGYGFTAPEVEKYFQFDLHDFCPYGGAGGALYRPGFGLYHNWPQFDFFVGAGSNCAVEPWDGDERPAYHAFYQASRWLRDLQGYTVGLGEYDPAEYIIFPVEEGRTHLAWARIRNKTGVIFPPSPNLSEGPVLLVYPDGSTEVKYTADEQEPPKYKVDLPAATHPQNETCPNPKECQPIIGGKPIIILEHLLFDRGADPPIFESISQDTTISFGLNLPSGILQGLLNLEIFDESGQSVYADARVFTNGEQNWEWDGDDMSGSPVPPGVYTYQITRLAQGISITGKVVVSARGVLACYFEYDGSDPPSVPAPALAYQDFRGEEILLDYGLGTIDFNYPMAGPPPIPELDDNEDWAARYAAYLKVLESGMYRFHFTGTMDDVARLFVDGILVTMPDWTTDPDPMNHSEPEIYLSAGIHTVIVEYVQATEDANLRLEWEGGEIEPLVNDLWQPGPALAAACKGMPGEWPMYMHDSAHTGYASAETVAAPPFVLGWSFSMPGYTMPAEVAPAVTEEHVYFVLNNTGTDEATIYALNPADGSIDWEQTVSGQTSFASSPATDGEKVYVVISNSNGPDTLYALSVIDGSIVWTSPFSDILYKHPVLHEGFIYLHEISNSNGQSLKIYRIDSQTGNAINLYTYSSTSSVPFQSGNPLVLETNSIPLLVYVAHNPPDYNRSTYFMDTITGNFVKVADNFNYQVLDFNLTGNSNSQLIYTVGTFPNSPNILTLAAIDPTLTTQTGILWNYDYGLGTVIYPDGYVAPVLVGNKLYHIVQFDNGGNPTATLFTFNAADGTLLSQTDTPPVVGGQYTFMTIANGFVYASAVSASGSVVRVIDLNTGDLLWESSETGDNFLPVVVAGGQIYFHGSDPQDTLLMYKPDN